MQSGELRKRPDYGFSSTALKSGRTSKKTVVLLLRWVLIIACSCLVLFAGSEQGNKLEIHLLVLLLIGSNLCLSLLPVGAFLSKLFDPLLVTFDIVFITASIWFSGQPDSELYLLYFLIIMIAAVGETLRAIVWSAGFVAVTYAALILAFGGKEAFLDLSFLIRLPFFFIVALFYGYLAQLVRAERSIRLRYRRELNAGKRIREVNRRLAVTLNRRTILDLLVKSILRLTRAKYCAVLSRGARQIVAESGTPSLASEEKNCSILLTDLERRLGEEGRSKPSSGRLPLIKEGELGGREKVPLNCFSNESFMFYPLSVQAGADLYLAIVEPQDEEMNEYIEVILDTASMALKNAGQYSALVQEVEKRQEMIKQLAEALKFKSDFAANISHEIRTPIYAFIGFAELLLQGGYGALADEQKRVIERMLEKATSLLEMINNILDHAKLEAGQSAVRCAPGRMLSFIEEIAETCEPLLKDKAVSIHTHADAGLSVVVTDWSILRQVVLNLVSNAVKFTPEGRVEISAILDEEESRLEIVVRDTGVGIPEDRQKEIFEPYRQLENSYTKRFAGTGLGLSITKRQVELLGGEILLQSKPGQGSRFTVRLPVRLEADVLKGSLRVIASGPLTDTQPLSRLEV